MGDAADDIEFFVSCIPDEEEYIIPVPCQTIEHKWAEGYILGSDSEWKDVSIPVKRCRTCGVLSVNPNQFHEHSHKPN